MNKRPISSLILTGLLITIIISFPVQVMFMFDYSIDEIGLIFNKLTWLNYFVMLVCLLSAYYIFQVSKFSIYFSMISILVVGLNNYWVGKMALNINMMMATIGSIAFTSMFFLLFENRYIYLLTHPDKRWWMQAKRTQVKVPVSVWPWVGEALQGSSFDISSTGLFMSAGIDFDIEEGREVKLILSLNSLTQIHLQGSVARIARDKTGHYPEGLGISFNEMDKKTKSKLQKYLKNYETNSHRQDAYL